VETIVKYHPKAAQFTPVGNLEELTESLGDQKYLTAAKLEELLKKTKSTWEQIETKASDINNDSFSRKYEQKARSSSSKIPVVPLIIVAVLVVGGIFFFFLKRS
jgi:hypothetical protein